MSEDGAIVADRQITDGCLAVVIAGYGNADRVAEDKEHDLALLRIYGARGLKPLGLANGAAKSGVQLSGLTASSIRRARPAALLRAASRHRSPPSAAAANSRYRRRRRSAFPARRARRRRKIRWLGTAEARIVAGPPTAAPAAQAALVPAETVREFLKANGVNASDGSSDAKASVVRVICVRK